MSRKVLVTPIGYSMRCEMNRCGNKAKYAISNEGGPRATNYNVCEDCLKGICAAAVEVIEVSPIQQTITKEIDNPYEEEYKKTVEENKKLKSVNEELLARIEFLKVEIEEKEASKPAKKRGK